MKLFHHKSNRISELKESGLLDRSERPTSHELFAPLERRKQREENRLRAKARQQKRGRRPRTVRIEQAR
ncbi:MAG TPA: hypothetical protein VMU54_21115 [Planctomycetota bacterium]|nr:hypothetical protein [Planctomycetota bacterium]